MTKLKDGNDDHDVNGSGVNRRKFGKALVAGVGGLTLAAASSALEKSSPKPPARKSAAKQLTDDFFDLTADVVIVGAGLSGLIAARELLKADKTMTVLILEANSRIGGRMFGRKPRNVPSGGYLDYGGQWVGDTQLEMLALVKELKIETFLNYEKGRAIQLYDGVKKSFDGDVSELLEGVCKPVDWAGLPQKCGQSTTPPQCKENDAKEAAVWGQLLELSAKVCRERPWETPEAKKWDGMTFEKWLDDHGSVDHTRWLPTLQSRIGGAGGFEPKQVSALHMAWTQAVGPQSETPEKWLLVGGAGQIPGKLESQLPANTIRKGLAVKQITQKEKGGSLSIITFNPDGTNGKKVRANKAVIVAIPPSLRDEIIFKVVDGGMPSQYAKFSNDSPMGSMSKVHAVYEKAFWRDDCLSGSSAGNLKAPLTKGTLDLCEFVADCSPVDAVPGILTSFISAKRNSDLTKELAEQYPGEDFDGPVIQGAVRKLVIEDFVRYFAGSAVGDNAELERKLRDPKDFVYYNWNLTRWTGGAFTTHLGPNVWTDSAEVGWRKPVGSVYWAGTETADRWPGYFDGAIRAGKAAAARVLGTYSPGPDLCNTKKG